MGDAGDGGHGGEGDEGGGGGGDEEEGNLAALVVRDGAHALRRLLRFLFLSFFDFLGLLECLNHFLSNKPKHQRATPVKGILL